MRGGNNDLIRRGGDTPLIEIYLIGTAETSFTAWPRNTPSCLSWTSPLPYWTVKMSDPTSSVYKN